MNDKQNPLKLNTESARLPSAHNCEFAQGQSKPYRPYFQHCRLFKAPCDTRSSICTSRASLKDYDVAELLETLRARDEILESDQHVKTHRERDLPGV